MDSDAKPASRTDEEDIPSVLSYIQEKLRPVLLRKWRQSRAAIVADAMEAGLTNEQLSLILQGFKQGYWTGAIDISSIKSEDLPPGSLPLNPEVH